MVYTSALSAVPRFQFDSTSGSLEYSQKYNCGPTCATMIAGFYKDAYYGIETTRRLVTGAGKPTTYTEQRDMLIKRGVPATLVSISSLTQLRSYVGSGRRPVILGVEMWKVPAYVRDHPFLGWHAVTVLGVASGGFWVNDPNFSPIGGYRPDPDKGHKFWPDWVMQSAFVDAVNSPCILPNSAKVIYTPAPAPTKILKFNTGVNGVNIRTSASTTAPNVFAMAMSTGIYSVPAWVRLAALTTGFTYRAGPYLSNGNYWYQVTGFGRTLYVVSKFMHFA